MKLFIAALIAPVAAVDEFPLTKIVNLLKNMEDQISQDAKADKKTYEAMTCWCKNTKASKIEAVSTAQSRITDLTEAIQEYAAVGATAEVNIKQLAKEVSQGANALAQARSTRESQADAWYQEEKDLVQAIAALKNALQQLSLRGGAALIHVGNVAERVMRRHEATFVNRITPQQRAAISALQQQASASTKNSDQIVGVLKSMLEEMEKDLEEGKKNDATAAEQFEKLRADKTKENAAGKAAISNAKSEAATASNNLERSKEDLSDTRAALAADREFLSDLNLRCQSVDKEYEQRVADRDEELLAVKDTIKILSDDDASEVTSRAISLLQESSVRSHQEQVRGRVTKMLLHSARKSGNADLLRLAESSSRDAFVKIKGAMDNMIGHLKDKQEKEVLTEDRCIEELHETAVNTADAERHRDLLENKIEELESTIEGLSNEIEEHEKVVADVKVQILQAGQNREAENADFQSSVKDQRDTQAVLSKAMARLAVVYAESKGERLEMAGHFGPEYASLAQQEPGAAAPPPPPAFDKAAKNTGSKGVVSMLESVMEDSKKAEADLIKDEVAAQADYEAFVNDSTATIRTQKDAITDKKAVRAQTMEDKAATEADHAATLADIEHLEKYNADLHEECDFLMKNFEARQGARNGEIVDIEKGEEMLDGAAE